MDMDMDIDSNKAVSRNRGAGPLQEASIVRKELRSCIAAYLAVATNGGVLCLGSCVRDHSTLASVFGLRVVSSKRVRYHKVGPHTISYGNPSIAWYMGQKPV